MSSIHYKELTPSTVEGHIISENPDFYYAHDIKGTGNRKAFTNGRNVRYPGDCQYGNLSTLVIFVLSMYTVTPADWLKPHFATFS